MGPTTQLTSHVMQETAEAQSAARRCGLDREAQRAVGLACKLLFDHGRLEYLRTVLGASTVDYVVRLGWAGLCMRACVRLTARLRSRMWTRLTRWKTGCCWPRGLPRKFNEVPQVLF